MADLVALARRMLEEHGFHPDPPGELAASLPRRAADAGVRDLRALPWSSIDGPYTRDIDQIEVADELAGGAIRLLVGIADVDVFVAKDAPLDLHAATNTTSLYTGLRTFPMLPRELSERTSLVEGVDRLAVVVEMVVRADGSTDDDLTAVYRARVHNRARLVYERVGEWLDGDAAAAPADPEIAAQVRLHETASQRLRAQRVARGALEVATAEARIVTEDDCVVDLDVLERTRAHDLVEDLMIATNSATAAYLARRGYSAIRRVVDAPRRWDRIVELARARGHALPATPDVRALGEVVAARRRGDPPELFADFSLAIVKLLGHGAYVLQGPGDAGAGHFGLAVEDYTHSTAPMRRHADLVTQRVLKAAAAGVPSPYRDDELLAIAAHCSERENTARRVERKLRKIHAATLLAPRIGETFEAVVTGVSAGATFVRLCAPPVAEGRVVRGEHGLDVGDRLRVALLATDPTRGFVDFARVY